MEAPCTQCVRIGFLASAALYRLPMRWKGNRSTPEENGCALAPERHRPWASTTTAHIAFRTLFPIFGHATLVSDTLTLCAHRVSVMARFLRPRKRSRARPCVTASKALLCAIALCLSSGASSSSSSGPAGRAGFHESVWRGLGPAASVPLERDLDYMGWHHGVNRLVPLPGSPLRILLALRGGGEGRGLSEGSDCASAGEGLDSIPAGMHEGNNSSVERDDDFSLGALSDAPPTRQSDHAEQAEEPFKSDSNILDDATAANGADGDGTVDGLHRRKISEESADDDVDIVQCRFERIGDKNGVFYYLGQQAVGVSTTGLGLTSQDDVVQGAGGSAERRRFSNPALTGRVQVKTGPMRIMCCSKFKGRFSCPEEVLERNVVGDQFSFPDGWVAIDLGLHTTLQPSHYMVRNGGAQAHDKVMTGWVLEGATWVKGDYWREGDWTVLDKHTNDTCFRDLALQAEADGSAAGYLHETVPPMRVDHRTGKVAPAIHPELAFTWSPTPIGDLPHHTLSFPVEGCQQAFRYIRFRQLTHAGHTHFGEAWGGHEDLYLQGMELYGTLSIKVLQSTVVPFKPCARGMWMLGMNRDDPAAPDQLWWARGAVDQCDADRAVQHLRSTYVEALLNKFVNPPEPRTGKELQDLCGALHFVLPSPSRPPPAPSLLLTVLDAPVYRWQQPSYERDFEDDTPSDPCDLPGIQI